LVWSYILFTNFEYETTFSSFDIFTVNCRERIFITWFMFLLCLNKSQLLWLPVYKLIDLSDSPQGWSRLVLRTSFPTRQTSTSRINSMYLYALIQQIFVLWISSQDKKIKKMSNWYILDVYTILTLLLCLKAAKLRSKRHWIDGYKISIWLILCGRVIAGQKNSLGIKF
jgi:hypothetical protein